MPLQASSQEQAQLGLTAANGDYLVSQTVTETPQPSRLGMLALFFCSLFSVSFEEDVFTNSIFWILERRCVHVYLVVCITEWGLRQHPLIKAIYVLQ